MQAMGAGDLATAQALLLRLVAADPSSIPGWLNLAAVRRRLDDANGAFAALREAHEDRAAELPRPADERLDAGARRQHEERRLDVRRRALQCPARQLSRPGNLAGSHACARGPRPAHARDERFHSRPDRRHAKSVRAGRNDAASTLSSTRPCGSASATSRSRSNTSIRACRPSSSTSARSSRGSRTWKRPPSRCSRSWRRSCARTRLASHRTFTTTRTGRSTSGAS